MIGIYNMIEVMRMRKNAYGIIWMGNVLITI